jgi:hypothetical protein
MDGRRATPENVKWVIADTHAKISKVLNNKKWHEIQMKEISDELRHLATLEEK